jgi:hypothetical protein
MSQSCLVQEIAVNNGINKCLEGETEQSKNLILYLKKTKRTCSIPSLHHQDHWNNPHSHY